MVKTAFVALLAIVSSTFLVNPSFAAEDQELTKAIAERDYLRARLDRAIAFSKSRGEQLEEMEKKLASVEANREAMSAGLSRSIAYSKERNLKLTSTEKQLASAMEDRKALADRLRRAIEFSKERGQQLEESEAKRKILQESVSRSIVASKARALKLNETKKQLAQTEANRKILSDSVSSALAASKARSQKLKETEALLAQTEANRKILSDSVSGSLAASKARALKLRETEKQLAACAADTPSNWTAQATAFLDSTIGGLQGTQVISDYNNNSVKVQLGNNGLFTPGGTSLSDNGKALLSQIAPQLIAQDASYTVIGHTDSIPVAQGSRFANNEALSFARAVSTLQYLRDQGIARQTISAAGYGADSPIAGNDTPEGRQQNRRVEIVLKAN